MNCPQCQHVNPDNARFCMECGSPLANKCPHCGTELPLEAKFCLNCGQRVAPQPNSPSAAKPRVDRQLQRYIPSELLTKLTDIRDNQRMVGERRIVTMLFCDVKGSTSMAETLDPEEWTGLMNQAFEYMIAPVYNYEGTVARLMGDAILAFFGAPITHEDDPQRAVLAGLAIIESIRPYREQMKQTRGLDFDVRVGINTGLVVVGAVGSDLRVEYTAMGDAVNLAARMEQTARPGTVQIAANTYKHIAPLIDVEALGGIEVKGKREPVLAYRVLGFKHRPGQLRGLKGLHSPMVGRDRDFHMLRDQVDLLRKGQGCLVSVIGEAGLGKSRLLAELRHSVASELEPEIPDAQARALRWYEGRSLSYQMNTPYIPFLHLLNAVFGLNHDQPESERYEHIKQFIRQAAPDQVNDIAPVIGTLLGLTLSGDDVDYVRYLEPQTMHARITQAVLQLFEALAVNNPLILVFEDLHWVDQTSIALLEHLIRLVERASILIIALFRPNQQDLAWNYHEHMQRMFAQRYTAIYLDPLPEHETRLLVSNLLTIEDLPEQIRLQILAKAEGNPFFVEEVIRSLLDAGLVVNQDGHWRATRQIEAIALPDTLIGVIAARLDRLDESTRHVAQTASVVGREFQLNVLDAVYGNRPDLDPALDMLQQRELIREKSRIPQRAYVFKHILTQEAAYQTLLLSARRDLHRRVAEYLEQSDAERIHEIALHYVQAEQPTRALPYLIEAGERAAKQYAVAEAKTYFRQAIPILRNAGDSSLARRAYEGLGQALMLANDIQGATEVYRQMLKLAEARQEFPMQISALNKLSIALVQQGQFEQVDENLTAAGALAQQHEDMPGLAEMYITRCMASLSVADFTAAIKYLSESVNVGRALTIHELKIFGLAHLANTFTFMLRFDEAWEAAQECHALALELGDRGREAEVTSFPIPIHFLRAGDLETAYKVAQESIQLSTRIGYVFGEAVACYILSQITQMRGEYERALLISQQGLQAARTSGFPFAEAMLLSVLGSAYLCISDSFHDEIAEVHLAALQLIENPAGASAGAAAWAEIGYCVLAQHDLDKAQGFFHSGLTIPSLQMQLLRPRLLVGAALVAIERGDLDEAQHQVDEAQHCAETHGMQHYMPMVTLTRGKVSMAQQAWEEALQKFSEAIMLASAMKMRPVALEAHAQSAMVLTQIGRSADAVAHGEAARQVRGEIGALFTDSKLRALFMANEPI